MTAGVHILHEPTQRGRTMTTDHFTARHISIDDAAQQHMLSVIGAASVKELIAQAVPSSILMREGLDLDPQYGTLSESSVTEQLRAIASRNVVRTSLIGQGYYGTHTPRVIARNVLENPAWYTAYTPYQPEISQGRLEALLNFQTMVAEIVALDIANASMLDESTAAAEAMTMAHRLAKSDSNIFVVDADTHPQTLAVLATRAEPLGITLDIRPLADMTNADGYGVLLSTPASSGAIPDLAVVRAIVEHVHAAGGIAVAITDLLACCLITPPGELGVDIAVGSAQRFGVPMAFGGPHAAFLATRESHARSLPGRLVGVSTDTAGRPSLRLALQTREQHIRREKATSNICTAQALLANIAGFYAAWHGPEGLTNIAERIAHLTSLAVAGLRAGGVAIVNDSWFDTVTVDVADAEAVHAAALTHNVLLRRVSATRIGFSLDETSTFETVSTLWAIFGVDAADARGIAPGFTARRSSEFLTQSTFHRYRTEHEMLRYLRRLADKDLALDRTMIPLGSCTMKLNATVEMEPISWPEFANIHPYAPESDTAGYLQLIHELEAMLVKITGYDAVSLQPNAGSQGEFAGLLAIRAYHRSRGDDQRIICLIPSSAHGTNAASATMAGLQVVVVACDEHGNVDMGDLTAKCGQAGDRLAALMITYPSTHGVFESAVTDMCALVHDHGGQVYVDGANLNALVGIAQPGKFGADVSHLNLHKTFCIPHGGGGPGVGPVAVRAHLAGFLPSHPLHLGTVGPVSGAPYGSAGILPISWVYIALMGGEGLRSATELAILSANYIAMRLNEHFPVLYSGNKDRVAHECILDIRPITKHTGISVDDIAKRLMDHGFHAPTMSFPVAGTLMVEPTESETLQEVDRFCDAMIAIKSEIDRVASGEWSAEDNPLRHAPHTVEDVVGEWTRTYPRELGLYPSLATRTRLYFPPVSRIDSAYGDRHLVCSCEPLENYAREVVTNGG